MIDTDKYEGHTEGPWTLSEEYAYDLYIYAGDVRLAKMDGNTRLYTNEHNNPEDVNAQLIADAPLLLEFIQKIVKEWNMPNKCNQEFGKDVRQLMYEYGLIIFDEETRRYEVKE